MSFGRVLVAVARGVQTAPALPEIECTLSLRPLLRSVKKKWTLDVDVNVMDVATHRDTNTKNTTKVIRNQQPFVSLWITEKLFKKIVSILISISHPPRISFLNLPPRS